MKCVIGGPSVRLECRIRLRVRVTRNRPGRSRARIGVSVRTLPNHRADGRDSRSQGLAATRSASRVRPNGLGRLGGDAVALGRPGGRRKRLPGRGCSAARPACVRAPALGRTGRERPRAASVRRDPVAAGRSATRSTLHPLRVVYRDGAFLNGADVFRPVELAHCSEGGRRQGGGASLPRVAPASGSRATLHPQRRSGAPGPGFR
jgi:hypothetical protein